MLTGLIVLITLSLIAWGIAVADRPNVCPKGHTDFYLLNGWHCRECKLATQRRRLRKLARERNR